MLKYIFILIILITQADAFWEKVDSIPPENQNNIYLDVFFLPENPDLGWVSGFRSTVLRTTDGGETWDNSYVPFPGIQLESIMFLNDTTGYASGPNDDTGSNLGYIFKSTDGGRTWIDVSPENNNFSLWGLYFTDEDYGVIMGGGCVFENDPHYMRSYYTTNGGLTWNQSTVNIEDNNVFNYSRFSDPIIFDKNGEGYAASSGVIWKTLDGGKEWNIHSYTGNLDWHEEITYKNGTILVPSSPSCTGNTAEPSDIRISTDDGESWNIFDTEMSMFGSFLHDELRGWGVGFLAEIYYTSDGGQSWELKNCGIENFADMDDIWFMDDTTGFVVGDGIYRYKVDNPLAPEIMNDKTNFLCDGDSVTLYLDTTYNYVEWSTGETSQTITVTEPGKYYAYAENSKCESGYTDTIYVEFYPEPDVNINKSIDGVLCDGDTLNISISGDFAEFYWDDGSTNQTFDVFSDSILKYTYISENDCIFRDSIEVNFMPRDEINILENHRNLLCSGYYIDLSADDGFSEYKWYNTDESEPVGDDRVIRVTREGFYYVVGINEFGCDSYSDTIFIEEVNLENVLEFYVNADTVLNIGNSEYSHLTCSRLTIFNNSDEEFIINNLQPIRNIEFSIPKSELPIVVPANDTTSVKVCYDPSDIELQRDTIIFSDVCSDRAIPIRAEGVGYADTTDGRCDIPVEFELVDIVDEPFLDIRKTYPIPAIQSINIEMTAGFTGNNQPINIELYDIFGNRLIQKNSLLNNFANLQKGSIANGIISIPTDKLSSGIYFLKISNNQIVKVEKISISK